jgi:hypothetical protein
MTRVELEIRLREEGFIESTYSLYGDIPCSQEGFILIEKNSFWQVLYNERGENRVLKTFDSETNACDWLYEELNKDPTMKRLTTPGLAGTGME